MSGHLTFWVSGSPTTLKKVKRKITDKSEWLTKVILISCVQKNNLFKKLKKTPSQQNELTYKTFKNKLTHIIRIAKKNYFKEKFDMHRNNGEKTWETISEILKNKTKKNTVTDTFITSNGVPCTDNTDIANNFNIFYKCRKHTCSKLTTNRQRSN